MGFEIINTLKKEKGLTNAQIAKMSGITLSTLDKITSGVNTNPKLDTLQAICKVLGCTLDDFSEQPNKISPSYSDEAMKLAKDYDGLDKHGKRVVRLVADEEKSRCEADRQEKSSSSAPLKIQKQREQMEAAEEITPIVTLPQPYTQVAAAEGAGAFLMDSEYDEITLELNDYTQKADTILKVVGRSMEPEIHDGDRILVREQPSVNIGEIGVFILDGQGYLKEWAVDKLISLNPNIEDVCIGDLQQVECYGKFIKVLDPDWIKK